MNLFDTLTGAENTALYMRLHRAGKAYDKLTSVLVGVPLATFGPYMAAWVEVNGLLRDLNEVRPAGAPSAFAPMYDAVSPAQILAADIAAGYAPTGTGWPVP